MALVFDDRPSGFHFIQRGGTERLAGGGEMSFHGMEARTEFIIGGCAKDLWIKAFFARQASHGKQEIAYFFRARLAAKFLGFHLSMTPALSGQSKPIWAAFFDNLAARASAGNP